MNKIELTAEQKIDLEALHDASREGRIRDLIKAVLLRSENGDSRSYLNQHQTADVIEHIMQHTYRYFYEIIEYIWKIRAILFSISGLNKWLHHNLSYKYSKSVPHKFDEVKHAIFIEYEEIKAQVADETLYLIDTMYPTQRTKVSCGRIRKGQDKPLATTGSRTRLNIIGAIDLNNLTAVHVKRYEKVNSETIQTFFTNLRTYNCGDKRIHIILDGEGYHRAIGVKKKAKELNIKPHYLPPYSPNLNHIERLCNVMSEHVKNNKYFATAKEFRGKIDEFFSQTLPERGDILAGRINDNC